MTEEEKADDLRTSIILDFWEIESSMTRAELKVAITELLAILKYFNSYELEVAKGMK